VTNGIISIRYCHPKNVAIKGEISIDKIAPTSSPEVANEVALDLS